MQDWNASLLRCRRSGTNSDQNSGAVRAGVFPLQMTPLCDTEKGGCYETDFTLG